MAKSDQKPDTALHAPNQTSPPDQSQQAQQALLAQQALVAAITEAFTSVRRDGPPPDPLSQDAAVEYAQIKAVLRTIFEKPALQGQKYV